MRKKPTRLPLHARLYGSKLAAIGVLLLFLGAFGAIKARGMWPDPAVRADGYTASTSFWMTRDAQDKLTQHGSPSHPPPENPCAVQVIARLKLLSDGRVELMIEANAHDAVRADPNSGYERTRMIPEDKVRESWATVVSAFIAMHGGSSAFHASFGGLELDRFNAPIGEVVAFVEHSFAAGPGKYTAFGSNPGRAKGRSLGIGGVSGLGAIAGLALLLAYARAVVGRSRIARGLCPVCAYPIESREQCTECGLVFARYEERIGLRRSQGV